MSVRTSLRQQPAEAVTAAAVCDIYPQTKQNKNNNNQKKKKDALRRREGAKGAHAFPHGPRSSVESGVLLTTGAEPPSSLVPLNGRRNAARRQRRAFMRDWGASAGGQVDTWHRRTSQRRRVNPASDEACHTVKSTSPFLSLPSVSASHAQVAARYRNNPYKIKAWTSGWQAPLRWDISWCI